MGYIYNDEDNAPMNDPFSGYHNPTVYSSRDEMNYYESSDYDREQDRLMEARDMKRSAIREGFLDDLGFKRDDPCRDCPWMKEGVIELFEDDADDDLVMPGEAYDLARRMCEVCKKHSEEERYEVLWDFFKKEEEQQ